MRVATVGNPNPYEFFGTFAGVPFWGGGLTLLPAAPVATSLLAVAKGVEWQARFLALFPPIVLIVRNLYYYT